jgi:CheY-like chemotaxis protein
MTPRALARILIVEDDPHLRDVVEVILAGPGYEIDSVADGQAALERLTHHTYDLVVCDLSMPGLDGRAVYHVIERQPPPRPAMVFLTGHAAAGTYQDFLRTTQAPVVIKPFDINVLRETVRRALSGN